MDYLLSREKPIPFTLFIELLEDDRSVSSVEISYYVLLLR